MLNKLFFKCYLSIDFIPDSNIDRKIAKAALFTSLFILSIINICYGLCCLTQVFSYNKTILISLILASIFGTYFYFVTNNRGRNIVQRLKEDSNKRLRVLLLTFFTVFGLLLLDMYIMYIAY